MSNVPPIRDERTFGAMRLTSQFVSVGVNRVVNALDWGEHGLIAYGGHWIVCIYDHQAAEVIGTLTGHKGQVNCVKWLPQSVNPAGALLLLSGAADNCIRLWAWFGQAHTPQPWSCVSILQAHCSPITSLALHQVDAETLLVASTSADPAVQLWHCRHGSSSSSSSCGRDSLQVGSGDNTGSGSDGSRFEKLQQQLEQRFGDATWQLQPPVHVGTHIQHCVALASLPGNSDVIVMATGGTDSHIRLFVRVPGFASAVAAAEGQEPPVLHPLPQQQQQQPSRFQLHCQLKGHENWVRGVAFTQVREDIPSSPGCSTGSRVSLLLATAAQDRYGRIWCISSDASSHTAEAAAAAEAEAAPRHLQTNTISSSSSSSSSRQADTLRHFITRYAPRPHLKVRGSTYWVSLEALLIGHEDWLHSVTWRSQGAGPAAAAAAAPRRADVVLLTSSQDRSMMMWSYDSLNRLWMSEAAVGDAGASCLGFYGGQFSPGGEWLVAHGFTGALHLWKQQQQQQQQQQPAGHLHEEAALTGLSSAGQQQQQQQEQQQQRDLPSPAAGFAAGGAWLPQHALGGHYGAVVDLSWGADGGCLQSVSCDQTARLFTGVRGHWFELARTQVHGHDFSCLATIASPISSSTSSSVSAAAAAAVSPSLLYVSGSEEKVLRVFEAPQAFIDTLTAVRSSQSGEASAAVAAALAEAAATAAATAQAAEGSGNRSSAASSARARALGASVAALGLSNKAVYVDDAGGAADDRGSKGAAGGSGFGPEAYMEGPDFVPCAVPSVVHEPPFEEHLAQNTLWPEIRKLYGHGNDVFCVCSSPSGRLIASACKAQSAGAAAVWVWEVGSWKPISQLSGHTLTVTQLEFSHDGRYLLSGSRDRSFSLWRVPEELQWRHPDTAAAAASSPAEPGGELSVTAAAAAAAAGGGGGGGRGFELVVRRKSAHSRIIWGVSWSHDSRCFATSSRDQTVKVWALDANGDPGARPVITLPPFPAGVTAVALAPAHVTSAVRAAGLAGGGGDTGLADVAGLHLLAVGLDDGQIQVWSVCLREKSITQEGEGARECKTQQLWASKQWEQHAATVRRLRWAPAGVDWLCGRAGRAHIDGCPQLASCGEDHSVRLFCINLVS